MWVELIISALFLYFVAWCLCQRSVFLPAGPRPFPVIGNLGHLLGKEPYLAVHEMSLKYGPTFTFALGSKQIVVIAGVEAVKLKDQLWTNPVVENAYLNQPLGELPQIEDHLLESVMKPELLEWMAVLRALMADGHNATVHSLVLVDTTVVNTLWALFSGEKRFNHHDPNLTSLIQHVTLLSQERNAGVPSLATIFPSLFPNKGRLLVEQHTRTFLTELMMKPQDEDNSYSIPNLVDLLVGGTQLLKNTLAYALLHLILNPKVQEKMFQEIGPLLSLPQQPCLSLQHRPSLPYTQAVLMEMERVSNVMPFTQCHKLLQRVGVNRNWLQVGTILIGNAYTLNTNTSLWGEDALQFRPERFINEEGELSASQWLLCPHAPFYTSTLFLYLTTLVANFKLSTVPGHLDPPTTPLPGLILCPTPFNLILTRRNS